ncbi:hypothetical protein PoB_004604100 [Plakobranchus ocellatus]|uniref:Uncharacterized protein n=1 Tax=Plakobranchus ocellatus TaxID=259542 RepID=A0AAV4BGH3_9GAST|nr:hypothetical protein PoB_004604100 [Plakobranchus ocellatus]
MATPVASDCTARSVTAALSANSDWITAIKDEEQYHALRRTFLAQGKGRRPDLPPITVTNKLILQLHALRQEGNESWKKLETWFLSICPEVASARIRPLVEKTIKKVEILTDKERDQFLSLSLDLDFISTKLSSVGITRATIRHPPSPGSLNSVNCGLVIELEQFCKTNNIPKDIFYQWLAAFYVDISRTVFEKSVCGLLKDFKKIQKNRNFDPQGYELFCNSDFSTKFIDTPQCDLIPQTVKRKCDSQNRPVLSPQKSKIDPNFKLQEQVTKSLLRDEQVKNASLQNDIISIQQRILNLTNENEQLKLELKNAKYQKWRAEKSLEDFKEKISEAKENHESVVQNLKIENNDLKVHLEKKNEKLKKVKTERKELQKYVEELTPK